MNARFEVKRSAEGGWFYQLLVADNQVMLQSEAYKTLAGCINGIESCKEHSPYDRFYSRQDGSSGFTFHLRASNNKVISLGQESASADDRERTIDTVKQYAISAQIKNSNTRT